MSPLARLVSLTVLTCLIVFLGITFFQFIAPFLLPLFLAGVIAVICQPIYVYFLQKTGNRTHWAAGLATATLLAIVLIPLIAGTFIASVELYALAQQSRDSQSWNQVMKLLRSELDLDPLIAHLQPWLGEDVDAERLQEEIRANLQAGMAELSKRSLGLAGAALGFLEFLVSGAVSLVMFIFALYYFFADGPALLAASQQLIPVHADYQRQLLQQFDKVVRAVVMATFLAAIAQGIGTAILLWVFGFEHFFILFIVATFAALIPLAGTWLVWGPCALWLAYVGNHASAVTILLIGSVVIGTMDNVIRTYVLHSDAKLHPLLAFVSVLGGIQVMGLWGVFIGPIVASCLHALIMIFNTELQEFSKLKFGSQKRRKSATRTLSQSSGNAPEKSDMPTAQNSATDNNTDDNHGNGEPTSSAPASIGQSPHNEERSEHESAEAPQSSTSTAVMTSPHSATKQASGKRKRNRKRRRK